MNCSPTLTAREFTQIHNGLCDLMNVIDRLDGVLAPELYSRLSKAKEQISTGLIGAYDQDDRAFSAKHRHYENVQKELGLGSVWSIYEVDDLNEPHPFKGATKVVYRNHWGNRVLSCNIEVNTWIGLYLAADECIENSGDSHHVFIENFKQEGDTLILSTGS